MRDETGWADRRGRGLGAVSWRHAGLAAVARTGAAGGRADRRPGLRDAADEAWRVMDLIPGPYWRQVTRCDPRARALADRHYSRQTVGAQEFCPPGRTLVLLGRDGAAVWAACENLDPAGARRWRVTLFRRESPAPLASDLIREATRLTIERWSRRWPGHGLSLTTEIDPRRTRSKRDPGRCFRRAGWVDLGERNGLVMGAGS